MVRVNGAVNPIPIGSHGEGFTDLEWAWRGLASIVTEGRCT